MVMIVSLLSKITPGSFVLSDTKNSWFSSKTSSSTIVMFTHRVALFIDPIGKLLVYAIAT